MCTGKKNPIFKNEVCIITDIEGRKLELRRNTWEVHILGEHKRDYFRYQFDKIILTVKQPDRIIKDSKEENVVHYEKHFNDFGILNTVLRQAYIYVIANWQTMRIRTIYANNKQRTKGKVLWPTRD